MPKQSITSHVLKALSDERRVVAADWRFHVIYRRIAYQHSYKLPDIYLARGLIRKLGKSGDIEPIESLRGVYRVTTPYASTLPSPDEIVVQEGNPFAVLSNYTAAAYHDLTDVLPSEIYVTNYRNNGLRLPLGTTPDDWLDMPEPARRTPKSLGDTRIIWSKTKDNWDFGHTIGYAQGCPFYVTDPERTLLDAVRFPEKTGGIREVLRIWKRAVDLLDVDRLVKYVDRFDQSLLRQRAGFLLERLRITHPILDSWAEKSVRGSSAKLAATNEFSPQHSERWMLSLNVPEYVLRELDDS
ncbi:MAG: hypothetical protein JXM70_05420 [Pirellulales bacterium]|nr:hypothetical protein [Pirellulales bacterium]